MRVCKEVQPIDICAEKEAAVTQEELQRRFTYHPDGYVISNRTGRRAGYTDAHGYRVICFGKRHYREHRIVWALFNGAWPSSFVDHIDRNRSNNRIENLREVPIEGNARNRTLQCNNASGFSGVFYRVNRDRWVARVNSDGRRITVGMHFRRAEDAAAARAAYIKTHKLEYYNE